MIEHLKEATLAAIAAVRDPRSGTVDLVVLSRFLFQLDEPAMATDVFLDAVDTLDKTNAPMTFALAVTAAEMGIDDKAVELLASFVVLREKGTLSGRRPLEVIASAGPEMQSTLMRNDVLVRAIRRRSAFEAELYRQEEPRSSPDDELANEEARAIFESTADLRQAALALRLQDHDMAQ